MPRRQFSGARLGFLVRETGLSVYALEQDLRKTGSSLDRATIARHVSGEVTPTVTTLADYADYFMVPMDFFFEWKL